MRAPARPAYAVMDSREQRGTIRLSFQRGGEGKTTAEAELTAILAARDERILLVEVDPQGTPPSGIDAGRFDTVIVDAPPSLGLADGVELRGSGARACRTMETAATELIRRRGGAWAGAWCRACAGRFCRSAGRWAASRLW
ncbi:ParA family protein [Nonomuraea sp. NPDC004297]